MVDSVVDRRLASFDPSVNEDDVKEIVNDLLGEQEDIKSAIGKALDDLGVKDLMDSLSSATGGVSTRMPVVAAVSSGNKLMEQIAPFYVPGKEIRTEVLVTSPPSFGKSFTIRELGKTYDVFMEHGCSDDIDEVSTLLGNAIPHPDGKFVIFDGVLTEAMRHAAAGKHTLILLDEVLRLPGRAQEWLLTFKTGYRRADGSRWFRLRTRRVDTTTGTDSLEVIEAPATHFHLVGAANLGLHQPIEAFWSRWFKVRFDWDPALAEGVAQSMLDSYGILKPAAPATPKLAKAYSKLVGDSRQAVKEGKISYPTDFRLFESCCSGSVDPTERGVADMIAKHLSDQVSSWDGDTGDTDGDSKKLVESWGASLKKEFSV